MSRGSLRAVARDVSLFLTTEASSFSLELLLFFFGQSCPSSGPSYVHGVWVSGAIESLLPLSFGSPEAFFPSVAHSVFEKYVFLVLDARGRGPLIP